MKIIAQLDGIDPDTLYLNFSTVAGLGNTRMEMPHSTKPVAAMLNWMIDGLWALGLMVKPDVTYT